ncbi:hypothetical protein [Marinomonas foliarum]|jgi:hypothetical protein|uniref:MORN repeat protein n=1 Tax=Marinomonas foliarum TaxID=491950 RepID=A0ABX7IKP3_9GAMM|nr:hypothetical protein [Marinomonas foliarum]QRV22880.1 hypothetical protein JSY38_12460 [Marinomonas foliarum]
MLITQFKGWLLVVCLVCTGCTTLQMPHGLGSAECQSGDCSNGVGTLYSPFAKVTYHGQWNGGEIGSGLYIIDYKDQEFTTLYKDGRPVSGTKFYPHPNGELDYFTGEWTQYYDPFSKQTITFPHEGVYYSATGATLTGEFYAIPSRGMFKHIYEENPDTSLAYSAANIIFIGKVSYQGEEEITTLASTDYLISTPFISSKYSGLKPSDAGMLAQFKRDLESEQQAQQNAKVQDQRNSFDFGRIIAIAATVAVASSDFSDLGPDVSMFSSSMNDLTSTTRTPAQQKMAFIEHKEQVTTQVQSNVNRIEQRYAPLQKTKPHSQQTTTKSQPSKSVAKPLQPTNISIETSGTTGSYFAYEQALNLSQTNAENKAHSLCRSEHNGRLKMNSGNMAKKNCQQNNNEFRCNVTMIFVCQKE